MYVLNTHLTNRNNIIYIYTIYFFPMGKSGPLINRYTRCLLFPSFNNYHLPLRRLPTLSITVSVRLYCAVGRVAKTLVAPHPKALLFGYRIWLGSECASVPLGHFSWIKLNASKPSERSHIFYRIQRYVK